MQNLKAIMEQSRREISNKGGCKVEGGICLSDATDIIDPEALLHDILRYAQMHENAMGDVRPDPAIKHTLVVPAFEPTIRLPAEQALSEMPILLGEQMANAVTYLFRACS
jgi:hypothetical protein